MTSSCAAPDHGQFPVLAAVRRHHVEQVDLAVAGELAAVAAEHDRGVEQAVARALEKAAAVEHDAVARRQFLQQGVGLAVRGSVSAAARLRLRGAALERADLGQEHEVGPILARPPARSGARPASRLAALSLIELIWTTQTRMAATFRLSRADTDDGTADAARQALRGKGRSAAACLTALRPPEHDPGGEIGRELLEPVLGPGLDEDQVAGRKGRRSPPFTNMPVPPMTM